MSYYNSPPKPGTALEKEWQALESAIARQNRLLPIHDKEKASVPIDDQQDDRKYGFILSEN
ncbi:hypothetical protein [Parendozoicomonas sp. Alg238-R29]|uniref:hypothetical protein n=1 Tax=Parendozoicomonas sp. Alg238-R29 TaxID=2993446 RepID=UPI00248EDE53|nr:hypothetical protein [Parendozoicomonas sp. Alg238-R29]